MGFCGGVHLEPSLGAQQGEPGQRGDRLLAEPGVLGKEGGLDADWCKGFLDPCSEARKGGRTQKAFVVRRIWGLER